MTKELDMTFQETKLVLLSVDLAGYRRAIASLDALAVAGFLQDWYQRCAAAIRGRGGRIVKYLGDACLATFPEDRSLDAVEAVAELTRSLAELGSRSPVSVAVSANVHIAVVAEGDFGPDDDRRYDVLGSGVNHLFSMGGGAGCRISEPVYRQLPNERRAEWNKQRPPATYTLSR
jgi:class 3 adenylate cyclase